MHTRISTQGSISYEANNGCKTVSSKSKGWLTFRRCDPRPSWSVFREEKMMEGVISDGKT